MAAIWIRELRSRMRGKRAFIFITVYLAILGGLLWAAVRAADSSGMMGAVEQVQLGQGIFAAVVLVETLVVVALAPAYTAGAISQEREKQTFDLLAVTPVSSLAIVIGKLLSGLSYLALVIGVSIPLASVAFLFGGIGPEVVFLAYLVLAVTGIGVGAIGVCCSALMHRTQAATVGAFITVAIIVVGLTAAWGGLTSIADEDGEPRPSTALLLLNPFVAQADLLCATVGDMCLSLEEPQRFDNNGMPLPPETMAVGSFWPRSLVAWALVGAGAVLVAANAITPSRRWRPLLPRRPRRSVAEDVAE